MHIWSDTSTFRPSRAGVPKFPNKSELSRVTLNLEQPAPDGSKEVRSVLGGGEKGDYFVHQLVSYLHTSSFKTRSCQNDSCIVNCLLQNEELFQISFHFWFLVLEYQARHTKHTAEDSVNWTLELFEFISSSCPERVFWWLGICWVVRWLKGVALVVRSSASPV